MPDMESIPKKPQPTLEPEDQEALQALGPRKRKR